MFIYSAQSVYVAQACLPGSSHEVQVIVNGIYSRAMCRRPFARQQPHPIGRYCFCQFRCCEISGNSSEVKVQSG